MMPFRDATSSVEAEVASLARARQAELSATPFGHRSLYVRRRARLAFGLTGTAGAAVVVATLLAGRGYAAYALLGSWAAAMVAYVIALLAATFTLRGRLLRTLALSDDPYRDAAALRVADPRGLEQTMAAGLAHASYAWPLIAATLLGPHTVHLLVAPWLAAPVSDLTDLLRGFEEWMGFSGLWTIPVFVYGVIAAWEFPARRKLLRPLLVATGISMVPGIIVVLPPLVVLATTAVILLVAYVPMNVIIDVESTVAPGMKPSDA